MGQRHQIYVKMPGKLGVAGFHHQWLYGMSAIRSLARVVQFYKAGSEYSPLKTDLHFGLELQSKVISALYSVDMVSGSWSNISDCMETVDDPRTGDNNDGITIIDTSGDELKYCFMSISHLEGEVSPKKNLVPMSAKEYLLCYYPKFMEGLGRKDRETNKRQEMVREEFDPALMALLLIEESAKLLSLAECKKLFPKMYRGEK